MAVHSMAVTNAKELQSKGQANVDDGGVLVDLWLLAVSASLSSCSVVNLKLVQRLKFVNLCVDFKGSGMCSNRSFYFINVLLPLLSGFSIDSSSVLK